MGARSNNKNLGLSNDECELVSEFFDSEYYLKQNPDIEVKLQGALKHYLLYGWKENRNPCAWFSDDEYLQSIPELKESGELPYLHYLKQNHENMRLIAGSILKLDSHNNLRSNIVESDMTKLGLSDADYYLIAEFFNEEYYLMQNPDVKERGKNALMHYLVHGWKENRNPCVWFSGNHYTQATSELKGSGEIPFLHYLKLNHKYLRNMSSMFQKLGIRYTSIDNLNHNIDIEAMGLSNAEYLLIVEAFDETYYLEQNPDVKAEGSNALEHYLVYGWKENRDPCISFSTGYYLKKNKDIYDSGKCPFIHYVLYGAQEGRMSAPFWRIKQSINYNPLISIIVPNYNHAQFLKQRLESIVGQSYKKIEIIILDDCSNDNSQKVINKFQSEHHEITYTIFNKVNSGGVFKQWQRGLSKAKGELIWICESDDFCELDFLELLVKYFADPSVMIAFGRIQFSDENGTKFDGLDQYREGAEKNIWHESILRPANQWFQNAFGVNNVIANVGGCIFRQQQLSEKVWEQAKDFTILGDWFLYIHLAKGGRIAYDPNAVAYFRQHGKNTSVKGFLTPEYYKEHQKIAQLLKDRYDVPNETIDNFHQKVENQYHHSNAKDYVGSLKSLIDIDKVKKSTKNHKHILIGLLGFEVGGGELFPIHLANELSKRDDILISVFVLRSVIDKAEIRGKLNKSIPIYEASLVESLVDDMSWQDFILKSGIDVIHSHVVGIENFFFRENDDPNEIPYLPYVVSLHGSYEVSTIDAPFLLRVLKGVSHWVYTTKKNLTHLNQLPLSKDIFTHIPNGMPIDKKELDFNRQELGIGCDDIVFCLVSRPLKSKGWLQAIAALLKLANDPNVIENVHLILVGDGEEQEHLEYTYGEDPHIHFLGYQDNIHGIYRMSDCVILPTRFKGESYPLCLIQAMQVGKPIIATDIGDIKKMLIDQKEDKESGIVIPYNDNDELFTSELLKAMRSMLSEDLRLKLGHNAIIFSEKYSMNRVAMDYLKVYDLIS